MLGAKRPFEGSGTPAVDHPDSTQPRDGEKATICKIPSCDTPAAESSLFCARHRYVYPVHGRISWWRCGSHPDVSVVAPKGGRKKSTAVMHERPWGKRVF